MGCCKSAPKEEKAENQQQPLQSDDEVPLEIDGIRAAGVGEDPGDFGIELESPTASEIDAVRFLCESGTGDIATDAENIAPQAKVLLVDGHADCGPQSQQPPPFLPAVHPPSQQAMTTQEECQTFLPGAITTPRLPDADNVASAKGTRRVLPRAAVDAALKALGPDETEIGTRHSRMEKAFAAFGDSSDEDAVEPGETTLRNTANCRVQPALSALEAASAGVPSCNHMDKALAVLDASDDDEPGNAWPEWVDVKPSTRVLLLTWVRWSKNSLRIKTEERLKALQHVKHPRKRQPVEIGPLSPQPTPRELPAPREPEVGDLFKGQRTAARRQIAAQREPASESLFNTMRDAQAQAMDMQCTKAKLTRDLPGAAKARTGQSDSPNFGKDTPNPWSQPGSSKSSAAPSAMGSGLTTPQAQAGQMSPWHMEAVCELGEHVDGTASVTPHLHDTWIASQELFEVERLPSEEGIGIVEYEDELEQVNMFTSALVAAPGSAMAADLASTKGGPTPSAVLNLAGHADGEGACLDIQASDHGQAIAEPASKGGDASTPPVFTPRARSTEFKIGQAVKYWSSSHRTWLPARVVDRKSKSVYIIDKQRRGCMAKIRASDLIPEEEESRDRVLRAFAVLERAPASEQESRPSSVSYPKPAAAPPRQKSVGAIAPSERKKVGRVARHDFSDDSDEETPRRTRRHRSRSPAAQKA